MWTGAHRRRAVATWLLASALLLGGTLLPPGLAAGAPSTAPVPRPTAPSAAAPPVRVHPPGTPIATAADTRTAGAVWYTQEGSTLSLLNGSTTPSSLGSLSVRIPLVKSPYPIGYELNGLSNVGDWYQLVIGDNWPGCSSGFAELTETWANSGAGNPPVCDTNLTMASGDVVQLGINYTSAHDVCFDLTDVTRSATHVVCTAPPDSGGRTFVTQSSSANGNGYFTGPMTEIANLTASSCPDYTAMPLVNYEWPSGIWVTGYIPWSDEWELGGTSTYCYGGGGGTTLLYGSDPATYYVDTAGGTSYGPHWAAGQNYSQVNSAFGWRFQTDPVPVQSPTVRAGASTVGVGATVNLTGTVQGGRSPYSFLWYLDGSRQATTNLSWTWTAQGVGTHRVVGYGVDALLDVGGPSSTVSITVAGPLTVGAVAVSTASGGADVGLGVDLRATPAGGIPPFRFVWSGLPPGCATANVSLLSCTPSVAGTFAVVVTVSDANGSIVASPALSFPVAPALAGALAASTTAMDTGQTVNLSVSAGGGLAPYSYAWSGLPGGCPPPAGAVATCAPTVAGRFPILVNLTDANGASVVLAAPLLVVYPAPSVTLTANRTAIDVNMSVLLTAQPSLGAGGFALAWGGLPANCPTGTLASVACEFPARGTYTISVTATDAVGGSAVALPLAVTVAAAPALVFDSPLVEGSPGGTLYLNATLTGGTPGVHYTWSGLPAGCGAPAGPRLLCAPAAPGSYNVTLSATDGAGGMVTAHATLLISLPPAPTPGAPLLGAPLGWLVVVLAVGAVVAIAVVVALRRRPPNVPDASA